MVFKGLIMFGAGVAGICAVSETVGKQVDRRFVRPIRNYRTAILHRGSFNIPEDLKFMFQELADGFKPDLRRDDE